jgi:hypothetical protein
MRVLALLALAACGDPLRDDVIPFDQLDYKTWKHTEVAGDAPGHSGFRTIYANTEAVDPTQSFRLGYQEGAILIKEVYNDAARTDLRHTAVMRRIGAVTRALENDGGWYYTEAKAGGDEQHFDFCFRRCHVAAPYNGAWLDYRDGR